MRLPRLLKLSLLLFPAIWMTGCSDPKATAIPTDLAAMEPLREPLKRLTPEEQQLFAGYLMRHAVGSTMGGFLGVNEKPIPAGMTLGKAIDEQREFLVREKTAEAEQQALKEKVLREHEKALAQMRAAVTVSLVSKRLISETGYGGIETDRKIEVVFAYKNNTNKVVAGVKGTADVMDLFGDELSGFAISNDSTIAPGATVTWRGGRSIKYGLNSSKDEKLGHLDESKYKVVWNPKMVVFADGTQLTAPD